MSSGPKAALLAQRQADALSFASADRISPRTQSHLGLRPAVVPQAHLQDGTSIRLGDQGRTRRRLVYGVVTKRYQLDDGGHQALLPPDRLAAYLVARDRVRALFFFRTGPDSLATTTISGVHPSVRLLFVASTSRAVTKATNSLRYLARLGTVDVESLPDGFWLRIADFVVRPRPRHILPEVDALLRQQRRGP